MLGIVTTGCLLTLVGWEGGKVRWQEVRLYSANMGAPALGQFHSQFFNSEGTKAIHRRNCTLHFESWSFPKLALCGLIIFQCWSVGGSTVLSAQVTGPSETQTLQCAVRLSEGGLQTEGSKCIFHSLYFQILMCLLRCGLC
jgi:hypothetical protein